MFGSMGVIQALMRAPGFAASVASPDTARMVVPMARQMLDAFKKHGAPEPLVFHGGAFLDELEKWIAAEETRKAIPPSSSAVTEKTRHAR